MQKFARQKRAWQRVEGRLAYDLLAVATAARPAVLLDYLIARPPELEKLLADVQIAASSFNGAFMAA